MFGKWRKFHLGINSHGNLLLPRKLIANLTSEGDRNTLSLSEIICKMKTTYYRIKEKIDIAEIKKLLEKKINSEFHLQADSKEVKIGYILSSFIDKNKIARVFQVYTKVKIRERNIIGIFERTKFKTFSTPWRFMGFLNGNHI